MNKTTKEPLVIWGAGGHSKSVADAISSSQYWKVECYIVDQKGPRNPNSHKVVFQRDPILWLKDSPTPHVFVAFGDNKKRQQCTEQLLSAGFNVPAIWHPTAIIAQSSKQEAGVFIGPNAVINSDCKIALGAIVNSAAVVEHDCQVNKFAHLGPGTVLGGGVKIGERANLGIGAKVKPHTVVGKDVTVGMGGVVINDVPSYSMVAGVPAREIG